MDSLNFQTNEIKLMINDDPSRVIKFDPSDVLFASGFYKILGEFNQKMIDLQKGAKELEQETAIDENGLPINAAERLKFVKEVCEYLRSKIDQLFGSGTSQTVFGDGMSIQAIEGFFEGVMPYVEKARNKKLAKHINKNSSVLSGD